MEAACCRSDNLLALVSKAKLEELFLNLLGFNEHIVSDPLPLRVSEPALGEV